MTPRNGPFNMLNHKGFSLIELMIAVAIVAIIASIAIPTYRNYISSSKRKAGEAVLEQLPVALESFRAENGQFPANGNYKYTENDSGTPTNTTLTALLPDFKPRGATQSGAILYDYSLTISNSGTATEATTFTAVPVVGRGAPAGNITGSYQ